VAPKVEQSALKCSKPVPPVPDPEIVAVTFPSFHNSGLCQLPVAKKSVFFLLPEIPFSIDFNAKIGKPLVLRPFQQAMLKVDAIAADIFVTGETLK